MLRSELFSFLLKHKTLILLCTFLSVLLLTHLLTYHIDSKLIANDKRPKFVIVGGIYKDGGTITYYGLGYQIIRWNTLTSISPDGVNVIRGVEVGSEIHRFPFFRNVSDGPSVKLKFISDEELGRIYRSQKSKGG